MNNGNNLFEANRQWASRPADERFETLDALRESVHGRRLRSRSGNLELSSITAMPRDGGLILTRNGGETGTMPSNWAFGQFCGWLKAPSDYIRSLNGNPELACQNLNYGIQKVAAERGQLKFMTVVPDQGNLSILQAVTGPKYGRIWDADVVALVQRIVERSNGKFFNPKAYVNGAQRPSGLYASDRDVFCFVIDGGSLLDCGNRAQLHRGFIVWNSETGSRTFGMMTFLFNVVCGNHIIWGAQDVTRLLIRHSSGGPSRFENEASPLLEAYANSTAQPTVDVIRKAQTILIPAKNQDEFIAYGKDLGKFTRSELVGAWIAARDEEGECRTLWQVVQGLTAYARGFDYIDTRVDLEQRAGAILNKIA